MNFAENHLPLVSILIPVYNVEEFLPKCLDSVLSQTYKNLQIVLVDDGSSDNSWSICERYAASDKRVEIHHQDNRGVAVARNVLLSHIKGQYVLFVDSDDWVEPNMVEFLVNLLQEKDADMSVCGSVINDCFVSNIYEERRYLRNEAVERFLIHKEFRGSLWNKLIKVNLLHNLSFTINVNYGEDALFCWDVLQRIDSIAFSDRELYHYRMNEASLSHGTFGPKKFSAYNVWDKISCDTHMFWPQYEEIAKSRFCIEMILLLRDAAKSKHSRNESIQILQDVVKNNIYSIHKTHMSSWKMTVYGYLVAYCYNIVKLLS